MKKILVFCTIVSALFVSCDQESMQHIAQVKTVSERVKDLNKSMDEIKAMEENEALIRDEELLLEYEYPVREQESYVVTYRFTDNKCYEIKLDTYLEKASFTEKVKKEVMIDIANNKDFPKTSKTGDTYYWYSSDDQIHIEFNTQHIERGTVHLIIKGK